MKLALVVAMLSQSAAPVDAAAVELRVGVEHANYAEIGGKTTPIYFPGDRARLSIRAYARTRSENRVFPADWARSIEVRLLRDGQSVDPRLVIRETTPEWTTTPTHVDPDSVTFHSVAAKYEIGPMDVAGPYRLEVRFREVVRSDEFVVVRGDETPQVIDLSLQRELAKGIGGWDEFKRLQLRRLEVLPKNGSALWALANAAEKAAPLEETRGYYERLRNLYLESGSEELVGYARAIDQILKVLPIYYSNRENLTIEKHGLGASMTVQLRSVDRPRER